MANKVLAVLKVEVNLRWIAFFNSFNDYFLSITAFEAELLDCDLTFKFSALDFDLHNDLLVLFLSFLFNDNDVSLK